MQQPPFGDPFGQAASVTALAPRSADLAGKTVVLFDNSKLDRAWGQLHAIYDLLGAELRARFPGALMVELSLDLLGPTPDPLGEAFRMIEQHRPAAAVLALADLGVSQRTMELSRLLEAAGIATCVIGAPPGGGLARAVAAARLPGLPVIELLVSTTQTRQQVEEASRPKIGEIVDALIRPVAAPRSAPGGETAALWRGLDVGAGDGKRPDEVFYERLSAAGLGDGLPVLVPSTHAVNAMLDTVQRAPDQVLFEALIPSGIAVTVGRLAANAVMAGCRPAYFPVVLAAFEAMTEPRYRLQQAAITTHPGANVVMVSGPLAERLAISGGSGCLGPGHRANLTIGRALSLTLVNVGRIRPGEADLASFGSAAEIGCCFAENLAASPWPGFNADHYDVHASCVLVHRAEFPHAVVDSLSTRPEPILDAIAEVGATIGGSNAYNPAETLVLLNPEHARVIANAGWSKQDVRAYLWQRLRIPAEKLRARGIPRNRPVSVPPGAPVPVVNAIEEVIVAVAGGPGPHSMVAVPWGAGAVHREIKA